MLAALMIVRRVGEYAFVRPGPEMLFSPLDAESKYKAKNFIDTVVYRAGDAVSAWAKALLDMLANGVLLATFAGALCAAAWGAIGWYLGGRREQRAAQTSAELRD
jgi:AAA family ATP:ADP antiporter